MICLISTVNNKITVDHGYSLNYLGIITYQFSNKINFIFILQKTIMSRISAAIIQLIKKNIIFLKIKNSFIV